MRMRNRLHSAALGAAGILTMGLLATGHAQPPPGLPDALTDARFFTGASGTQGVFPGKLVCLCCDFQKGDTKTTCKETSHRLALQIEGDPTIHPLIAGDSQAMKQLSAADLHGKQVSVTGILYPNAGVIVVASITPKG